MTRNVCRLVFAVIMLIGLIDCRQRKDVSYGDSGRSAGQPQGSDFSEPPGKSEGNMVQGLFFNHPQDWFVEVESDNVVIVKDTDRQVMLSTGFAPDDYFMPNGWVNDEKYEEHYVLVRLEIFNFQVSGDDDWKVFIGQNLPEVKAFETVQLEHDTRRAISPILLEGAMLGEEILIIALEDKVVIASLHVQGTNSDAHEMFMQIVNSLS